MSARRVRGRWLLGKSSDVWPICTDAAEVPPGWPGWPNGKQFAFVLTHDVEGRRGLERCRQLAELEQTFGLRSSFNFVPEGEYRVPDSLRTSLEQEGFEVGVHDLHHDGTLYRSWKSFEHQSHTINHYLRSWNVVGFRAGFMFHNLRWLHQLNVLYDLSTFDTDPFEPQPDGVNTIFPFWVQGDHSRGYVELPYTLPQDSTLFLVLQERDDGIWRRKLDWVAAHGGMALLNVHPDYMNFDGNPGVAEYPAAFYRDFLKYVSTHYRDRCWFALPREVATYVAQFKPTPPRGTLEELKKYAAG
jgi:hypothetical protein